ncbi:hypothetical protein, partial [Mesorhizobium sp.]|uniref:hypothetical protein n=1 Tax=Mesorhizobium sp. TaxID=1871066 RepID=UPI0025D6F591
GAAAFSSQNSDPNSPSAFSNAALAPELLERPPRKGAAEPAPLCRIASRQLKPRGNGEQK